MSDHSSDSSSESSQEVEMPKEPIVLRDDWEAESEGDREKRRSSYRVLEKIKEEKDKSLFRQGKMLVPQIIALEDAILGFKDMTPSEADKEKFDANMEKIRVARELNMERLRAILIACAHGWDVFTDYEDNRDNAVSSEKAVLAAVERVRKRKKTEKESSSRSSSKNSRDKNSKRSGGCLLYTSPSPRDS